MKKALAVILVLAVGLLVYFIQSDLKRNVGGEDLLVKEWFWQSSLYNDGREIFPKRSGSFSLVFSEDGKFTAKTDCNSVGGSYTASQETIVFEEIYMTKMFCEGSQETEFVQMLENTSGYHFGPRGELILDLKFDSGSVVFR